MKFEIKKKKKGKKTPKNGVHVCRSVQTFRDRRLISRGIMGKMLISIGSLEVGKYLIVSAWCDELCPGLLIKVK